VIVTIVSIIAVGGVAVILFMGLWNMFRGGDANRSQMLMRARVVAQFVALIVILGALYFFGQGHAGS
jgi:Hypoxia induced protein conserved region